MQKFLIGRELLGRPKVFIVSNPTWGVDAKAQLFIHKMLIQMADAGASIVLISQDIDDVVYQRPYLCDLSWSFEPNLPNRRDDPDYLGALMLGQEVES